MAILELMEEIPDLHQRIQDALPKNQELSDHTYNNGVFISPRGNLTGILGYDSKVRLRFIYDPTKIADFNSPENIRLNIGQSIQIIETNHKPEEVESYMKCFLPILIYQML